MEEIEKVKLRKEQELLLKKLVDMNSMWDYDSKFIRNNIYNLFFDWTEKEKDDKKKEDQTNDENRDGESLNEEQEMNAEQDLAEKKMRAQIRLDQELFEFEERGGFP